MMPMMPKLSQNILVPKLFCELTNEVKQNNIFKKVFFSELEVELLCNQIF